jgi:tetratricopeptide (TPR) repeat protein
MGRAELVSLAAVRLAGVFAGVCAMASAQAAERCEPTAGRVSSIEGQVEVLPAGAANWLRSELNAALCQGDTVRTGRRSRAAISLANDAVFRLDESTTLRLVDISPKVEQRSLLGLIQGAIQSFSRAPRRHEVSTPYLNAIIEGTEFVARVEGDRALIDLSEGRITGTNERGRIELAQGQSLTARAGAAPQGRTEARPMDAVQWALYYPPLLAVGPQAGVPRPLSEALARAARNDAAGALDALDRLPAGERTAAFFVYRAAILLSVGRVPEARTDIDAALARDARAGLALALRAVIGVAQNDKAQALIDATRAVEAAPREAAAKIALSYALQAHYRLEEARDAMVRAVAEQPNDALAMARLSELWLMLGYRDRAVENAQQAAALAPDLARVQTVLGFAALTQFRTATARQAFGRAIQLDSADPLPHLGLGLARIREGGLEEGRKDIEVAVALDARNALLRAYLGKAYFEEKRGPLDGQQYQISKNLDPSDPTPYLYDAIRKQSEGRPGEALTDIQGSIERNDNRAVYRGRLQLDQDLAARGASLGRIYEDLGFHQLGVNEAATSLVHDPANASAHRFLSDSYRGVRRREIARVSELLQAQLMQDININPVQPSLSEANLNIVTGGGPAQAGFNEFTPLFERNRVRADAAGIFGGQGTKGDEVVVSGLHDRFSISAGQFFYDTEGFRTNNGLRHEIYNLFAQAALTSEINVQAEYRRRRSHQGDLFLDFDPNLFSSQTRQDVDQDVVRLGARYSPSPSSDVLFSYIHGRQDRSFFNTFSQELFDDSTVPPTPLGLHGFETTGRVKAKGDQYETQYLFRRDGFNVTGGLAYTDVGAPLRANTVLVSGAIFDPTTPFEIPDERRLDTQHRRGYVYANVNLPRPVTWTLGVSLDDYEEPGLDQEGYHGKFGVRWDVTDDLRLRGAVIHGIKPALAANQVLEPTQVAGFNQLFDDIDGTKSKRHGGAVDWRAMKDVWTGLELSRRVFEEPSSTDGGVLFEKRREDIHRAYVAWTPAPAWALSGEVIYDHYRSRSTQENKPTQVRTVSAPVRARYFHSSGMFAGIGVVYVDQRVDRPDVSPLAEGSDEFFVVDATIGYRFPNRSGLAGIEARNLFDKGFRYQDDNFREFSDQPQVGPYLPGRVILARVTLSY